VRTGFAARVIKPKWRLSHAQGYLGLGMVAEAAAELDHIPAPQRDAVEVLALRMAVLQEQQDWPALRAVAAEFIRHTPGEPAAWVTWAYAVRRSESLTAAEKILLEAEKLHPSEPTIQFNLGCYACQRGDLAEARRRVDRAIALDPTFAALAATDEDLAPLRG
jgi:Tfp pilus assembly protein PilF